MSRSRLTLAPLAVGVSALAIAACGGSSNSSSNNGGSNTGSSGSSNTSGQGGFANVAPGTGKKGGTLKVQSAEGFEHLDPGQ
jgi:peptide/nickel transport system substrate-binding protein